MKARPIHRRRPRFASLFFGGESLKPGAEKADHDLIDQGWRQSIRPGEKPARSIRKDFDFRMFDAPDDGCGNFLGCLNVPDRFDVRFHIAPADAIAEFRFGRRRADNADVDIRIFQLYPQSLADSIQRKLGSAINSHERYTALADDR